MPPTPDVPPTEPQAPPPASRASSLSLPAPRVIAGSALAPQRAPGVAEEQFWFWAGARFDAPYAAHHVAGIEFQKRTDLIFRDKSEGNRSIRIECAGALLRLSRAQLEALGQKLPTLVVRPLPVVARDPYERELNDDDGRPAPATVLVVEPAEELEKYRQRGRTRRPFVSRFGDRPLAEYLYLKWIDEVSPSVPLANTPLPPPLSETGLVVPPEGARAVPATERVRQPDDPRLTPVFG